MRKSESRYWQIVLAIGLAIIAIGMVFGVLNEQPEVSPLLFLTWGGAMFGTASINLLMPKVIRKIDGVEEIINPDHRYCSACGQQNKLATRLSGYKRRTGAPLITGVYVCPDKAFSGTDSMSRMADSPNCENTITKWISAPKFDLTKSPSTTSTSSSSGFSNYLRSQYLFNPLPIPVSIGGAIVMAPANTTDSEINRVKSLSHFGHGDEEESVACDLCLHLMDWRNRT